MTLPVKNTPSSNPPSSLWKVEDVAAYLKLNPETVRIMARSGEIPSMKIGKRLWRFDPDQVAAWLDASKEPASA